MKENKTIEDIMDNFRKKFDTQGKKTYIGDLLQYENKKGDILFTIDDIKEFLIKSIEQAYQMNIIKMHKIYEGDNMTIFHKDDIYIGEQAEVADELIEIALAGYLEFISMAKHQKDKKIFWKSVKEAFLERLKDISDAS
jgi:hypothetical protein